MPGVRLHHETLQNCVVAVEASRPYPQPYNCPLCGTVHFHKMIHLNLDNEGDVIVSKEAWAEIKDVPNLPFTAENEVGKPPALILGLNGEKLDVEVHEHPFEGRR